MPTPIADFSQVFFVLEMVGVVAFAIAGALKAIEKEMDIFGILVLAVITALGGGFIRDLTVNRFPITLSMPIYFYAGIGGGLLGVATFRLLPKYLPWLKVFDALGLAVFSVLGAQVGLTAHLNYLSVLLLGMLTGIGGGVLRDVLANDVPLVFRQEIYALASLLGITAMVALIRAGVASTAAVPIGAALVFAIRLAAIRFGLNLPRIRPR